MKLREASRGLVFTHERDFNMSWLGWTPLIPSLVHTSVPCSLSVFSYLVEARAVGTGGDSRCPTLLGLEHLRLQATSTHLFIHIEPSLSVTGTPALSAAFMDVLTKESTCLGKPDIYSQAGETTDLIREVSGPELFQQLYLHYTQTSVRFSVERNIVLVSALETHLKPATVWSK